MAEDDRTTQAFIAALAASELAGQSADWLLFYADLLRDNAQAVYVQWKVAENELRATQRLMRLARKHEDSAVAELLSEDAAYLTDAIAHYRQRWSQCSEQARRVWRVLEEAAAGPGAGREEADDAALP